MAVAASALLVLGGLTPAQALSVQDAALSATTATTMESWDAESTPSVTVQLGDESLATEPQLAITGTVIVAVVDEQSSSRTEYWVETASGSLQIAGELDELTNGSTFTGTVAIPESVSEQVSGRNSAQLRDSAEQPIDSRATAGTELMQLAQTQNEPMQVVTGEATTSSATFGTAAHTVDVAVINGASFSDSEVNTNVSAMDAFWVSQTNNAITSVTRPSAVQRYTSSYLASCNFNAMWNEAAKKFLGPSATASNYFSLSGRHLVILAYQSYSGSNCGTGIGTVGSGANGSGLLWANMYGPTDLHTIAHEFGHNLGLGHSNVHECSSASLVEGTSSQGCQDYEYEDLYDVMSLAFDYGSVGNTNQLAALNVTDKVRLDVLPSGDLRVVTATSETVNLSPASDSSGVRGVRVTDSLTGTVYYVEYRSGTGMDNGAFYTKSFPSGAPAIVKSLRPGVRILQLRSVVNNSAASAVLAQLKQPGDSIKMLALTPGGTFQTPSGGLSVSFDSVSVGKAVLSISSHALPSTIDRVAGDNRFATAVAVSQAAYPGGAPVVYVAQGMNYPDALGAAPAAVKEGGPLLLTASGSLNSEVKAEIERLNPSKIVLVGGSAVVKPAVFDALKAMVDNTIRIGGADRYDTARLVVAQAFSSASIAYVASGTGFPDALSASAAGGATDAPVILINGNHSSVDSATKALLTSLGVSEIRVAGGTGVVSAGAASSLATVAPVTRSAGSDRFDTNHLVNSDVFSSASRVFLATGYQFPDALAGAAIAGAKGAPLYLVKTSCIPPVTRQDIVNGDADHVTLIGGTGVLTNSVKSFAGC